ncbi:MAG: NAD-binding protein, partial [Leptospiraceae bacterium]|nr:NAD-binding protein [Leptospiraceae bacterium]
MKIIICGVGDVGLHLARKLSQGEHHITLIDLDERLLNLAE